MDYGIGSGINADQTVAVASNIRAGDNPAYTSSDFLGVYPQFGTPSGNGATPNIPTALLTVYIDLANACVKQSRWRGAWELAMGLFVAHFCTLWYRSTAGVNDGKEAIINAAKTQGIVVSESADSLSYSMDIGEVTKGLEGFAMWKSTEYGAQLATLAKMYGKGGMGVV